MARTFDAIIVGAGQAGPPLAERLGRAGMQVALIERGRFGGTCVNTGCMPTKALVAHARVAHVVRTAGRYGVNLDSGFSIDFAKVMQRGRQVADTASGNVRRWLESMQNVTVIRGHARFTSHDSVRVGDETLQAPKIFLDVGGRAVVPDFPGIHDIDYLTNSSVLRLDSLPERLVVVGGSYIGLEFAQMFRRFGSEVTLIERSSRLISREDDDVSLAIAEILRGEGVDVRTGVSGMAFTRQAAQTIVQIDDANGRASLPADRVLLALGRRPNTDDLGLDKAGIEVDEHGYIAVDDQLRTAVPGIWALGDCNGRAAFTHTAYNDFEIVAADLLDGESRGLSQRILGYALYIDPPLGRVGMTERQARASGRQILMATRPMHRVGRAVERDETAGFMKLLADAQTREILGASLLGVEGDEAIHGVLDLMNAGATVDDLIWAVPIHPTVSELWPTVARALQPVE